MVLIGVAVFFALLLLAGWWVDHRDRKEGHKPKNAKQLGGDIRTARRARRETIGSTGLLSRMRPDRTPRPSAYVPPDGTRRPVKRGQ